MGIRPFVSVVVPTYNRKEMLKECLDSLFNQTYPKDKYEIIVVNDGSTDGTEEVLKKYKRNAPCKFKWFSQENKGASSARNLGIRNAKGEIICFIDDDCVADEKWIENLVRGFDSHKIGGVGGEFVPAQEPRTYVEKYEKRILNQRNNIRVYILTGNSAFRREVIDLIKGFDENLKRLEDLDLSLRLKLAGYELKYVPEAIVYYHHIKTLRDLMKQKYRIGLGFGKLCRKYDFLSIWYYLTYSILKIILLTLKLPFMLVIKKKKERISLEVVAIVTYLSHLAGLMEGLFFENYPGEIIYSDLDFIEEGTMSFLIRKFWSKLLRL